ncbi:MAG: DUF6063 family protein [Velocimicrobium sp.]
MTYEMEDISYSQTIFYYLLKNKELKEENARELYRAYAERDTVMKLVKQQAELADCDIERYGDTIYLIPKEENDYLGFSKAQLKVGLCKSGATDKDYYLSQFLILTLLVEFYNGQGSSSKVRDFMRVGELLNCVSQRLEEGVKMSEEVQQESGIAYQNMYEAYQALRSTDNNSRAKTTKGGFAYTILNFLEKQGLIIYIEADEMIKTTKKLDHFMDWNLLNKNNFHRVLRVLGVEEDEQN